MVHVAKVCSIRVRSAPAANHNQSSIDQTHVSQSGHLPHKLSFKDTPIRCGLLAGAFACCIMLPNLATCTTTILKPLKVPTSSSVCSMNYWRMDALITLWMFWEDPTKAGSRLGRTPPKTIAKMRHEVIFQK